MKLSDPEQKIRTSLNVHLKVGDKLKAKAIQLFVDTIRPIKIEVKEGLTSTHGGQLFSTNKRSIGKIKYAYDTYKKLLGHSPNI